MRPPKYALYYPSIIVSKTLNVSRITVYRYIKEGKLKAVKVGRNYYVCQEDFQEFIFRHYMSQEFRDGLRAITRKLVAHLREEELETPPRTTPDIFGRAETD